MDMSEMVLLNSSRLKSLVWNDFDRVKKGDATLAICRHCKKKLSGSSTSGTSHLRNHLIRCRRRSSHDIAQIIATRGNKKDGNRGMINYNYDQGEGHNSALNLVNARYEHDQARSGTISVGSYNFDHLRSRYDLARMIIMHGYPLDMVDHVGFQIFVKHLQPLYELVSFDVIEADCMDIYEKERRKVYDVLDKLCGKISLSANMWTGWGDAKYLCLKAHYIDEDWQLKRNILNFIPIDSSCNEELISEAIMTCLMDWDIDRKLFSMTMDNYFANDNIVHKIKDRLSQNRFPSCNVQLFDVQCATNVINLMVQDAIEAISEVTHKIRKSIQYVQNSKATLEKFSEMALKAKVDTQKCLFVDNLSNWNSTYQMLVIALEHKLAFRLLQEHDPFYAMSPSILEWERVSAVTSFLKPFIEVSNVFAANKNATPNIYFAEICDLQLQMIEWCKSSDQYITSLALPMKQKFDQYWDKCSLTLAVAAILDPRFKMKLVEFYYPQVYSNDAQDRIKEVSDYIKALYNEHSICLPLASNQMAWQEGTRIGPDTGIFASSVHDVAGDRLTGFDKFLNETNQEQNVKTDLDKYLEEPLFPRNTEFSILNWWKVHKPKYPVVYMMARNMLGIPLSKVTLDSAFNIRGRVVDPDWSSLSPTTLQALMCAQDWLRDDQDDYKVSSSQSRFGDLL